MDNIFIASGWTITCGGSRKGSYIAIEKEGIFVDATVVGWLDNNCQPAMRKAARYALVRKWSHGGDGLPDTFAVASQGKTTSRLY